MDGHFCTLRGREDTLDALFHLGIKGIFLITNGHMVGGPEKPSILPSILEWGGKGHKKGAREGPQVGRGFTNRRGQRRRYR